MLADWDTLETMRSMWYYFDGFREGRGWTEVGRDAVLGREPRVGRTDRSHPGPDGLPARTVILPTTLERLKKGCTISWSQKQLSITSSHILSSK